MKKTRRRASRKELEAELLVLRTFLRENLAVGNSYYFNPKPSPSEPLEFEVESEGKDWIRYRRTK